MKIRGSALSGILFQIFTILLIPPQILHVKQSQAGFWHNILEVWVRVKKYKLNILSSTSSKV